MALAIPDTCAGVSLLLVSMPSVMTTTARRGEGRSLSAAAVLPIAS